MTYTPLIDADEDCGFTRTGHTHPLGTFNAQLERINMHAQTIDILRGMAAKQGLTLSEFVRLHLDAVAYGLDGVARMHAERVKRIVSGEGV